MTNTVLNNSLEVMEKYVREEIRFRTYIHSLEAETDTDEEAIEECYEARQADREAFAREHGEAFARVCDLYFKAVKNCNSYIDIHNRQHIEKLAETMKAAGVEKFTISSDWSGVLEDAMSIASMYKVTGMTTVKVNGCEFPALVMGLR